MARASKTFRVFVSSTFSDLKAERDALQEKVFPRLRELCAAHGARFQAIDLRWGVSQQASRDQQTMNICLSEIARCQKVTPRPNFIVLLGDRYGWCPPPPQISADEFDALLPRMVKDDQVLLTKWYRCDDNAVPAQVVLQPWDDYSYEAWLEIETHLHQILQTAAGKANLDEDSRFKYWASATHQEIATGALKVEDADQHVYCFFRDMDGLPDAFDAGAFLSTLSQRAREGYPELVADSAASASLRAIEQLPPDATVRRVHVRIQALLADAATGSPADKLLKRVQRWLYDAIARDHQDLDNGMSQRDPGARDRIERLKEDLKAFPGNVCPYQAEWTPSGVTTDHIDRLCEDVYQALKSIIEQQLDELEEVDPLTAEIAAHEAFGEERARFFTGRTTYLQRIETYLDDTPPPLAIWGESGSGKSALLAKAVQRAQEACGEEVVVYRFIGATPESSNGRALLEGLCRQISRRYGADMSDVPLEYNDLVLAFPERLALATVEKPLIVFIDALDQLSDVDNARALTWLPRALPEHVRLVVSTLPGECRTVLEAKLPQERLVELEPMPQDEAEELLDLWLEDVDRTLQPEQHDHLLTRFAQCPKPLYLKLAFEEARRWRSYDGLPGLSDAIPGIIRDLFARLSHEANHGETLVSRGLGYLAAAKNGLTEGELLDVLARDVDVYAWFLRSLFHAPPDLLRRVQAYLEEEHGEGVSEEAAETWLGELRQEQTEEQLHRFLSTVLAEGDGLRLPLVLWSRLYHDLEPYLTERAADGTSLLTFYHPTTFGQAVLERYLGEKVREARHRALAAYFDAQPLTVGRGETDQANLRRLAELPYQQAQGHLWTDVRSTLSDFEFLWAKVGAVGPQPLIEDYDQARAAGYIGGELSVIQSALQLSAYILAQDSSQLPGQITGRLMAAGTPLVQNLLEQIEQRKATPWLWPLRPSLVSPGGALMRTMGGHQGAVHAVALAPDGAHAVSASMDHTLKMWDLYTGEELLTLKGHTDPVFAVAVTPDGTRAVSASGDHTLKVWDLETGEELRTLVGHTQTVYVVAVSPDGQFAVSGSEDRLLKVWNLATGEELCTLRGHQGYISAVAVASDGRRVFSASAADRTLRAWNLENGEHLYTVRARDRAVTAMTVTPDANHLIFGATDRNLWIRDTETEDIRVLAARTQGISCCTVTPDGNRVVYGDYDHCLKVLSLATGQELLSMEGHTDAVSAVMVSPDGKQAVSSSLDGTLRVWDLQSEMDTGGTSRTTEAHTNRVLAVAVSPDGTRAVSGSMDKTLKVWDLETGKELRTLRGQSGTIYSIALTPDGTRAISSGSTDGTVKVWDIKTFRELHSLEGHRGSAMVVAVTPDGRRVVSGSEDHTLKVWDLETGREQITLIGHTEQVTGVVVTPDGKRAISRSSSWPKSDPRLKAWDLDSGEELHTLEGHTASVFTVAVTPDGTRAVSGSDDHLLKVWDLETGQVVHTLKGHGASVFAVAVTPDGTRAVSGSRDRALKVWDLETGLELYTLEGHTSKISNVAITTDARHVISGSDDNSVRVWNLESGEEVAGFTAEGTIHSCCVGSDGLTLVAGDSGGEVHILRLENVDSGPPIVTAWRRRQAGWMLWQQDGWIAFGCPHCLRWSQLPGPAAGAEVSCPKCGEPLVLNPFTIDADWRPVAAAWRGERA